MKTSHSTLEAMNTEELAAIIMADLEPKPENRNCGRIMCAWCKPHRDLGPAHGLPRGEITHGICPTCLGAMMAEPYAS